MAYTRLTDLVIPESFADDVLNASIEKSKVFASGAVSDVTDQLEAVPSTGTIHMPFWNDLSGDSQVAHNGVDLTVNGVTQGQDKATVLSRAQTFGSQDLAGAFKGEDPIAFIESRFGEYWAREYDRIAVQNILAAMATTVSGASMAANVFNISALSGNAKIISSEAMIDAAGVLGDDDDKLTMVLMHSNVRRKLEKLDLIDNSEKDSDGKVISRYRDRLVISTDRLTASSGTYSTIFVGVGAVGYARGTPKFPAETHRLPLTNGGQEVAITRNIFAMHPRGIAFTATPAGETATDTELATASKWGRAWTAQNIRLAVFKHKIA